MELLQLEYFYAVAKTQHVTHTAEQLHIAQPALTQSIHRLEKELGVPLFHRSGRNIALTEYGVYLRDALKPILENLHELPEVLQEMANVRKRTIRVNVLAASTLVTHALISYQKSHSGLNFRLIQNSSVKMQILRFLPVPFSSSQQMVGGGNRFLPNGFLWLFRKIRPMHAVKVSD